MRLLLQSTLIFMSTRGSEIFENTYILFIMNIKKGHSTEDIDACTTRTKGTQGEYKRSKSTLRRNCPCVSICLTNSKNSEKGVRVTSATGTRVNRHRSRLADSPRQNRIASRTVSDCSSVQDDLPVSFLLKHTLYRQ